MKLLRSAFLLSSLFSLSLMAQRGGGHAGGGGGGFRGGGGGYAGGFRGGYGGYYGGYRGYYGGWGFGYGGYWPYYAYGYGYPYSYGAYDPYYNYAPAYSYSYAAPAPATTYAAPAAPATTSYYRAADYYLIAFSDHSIRAASAFHVDGDQLRWTPKEGGPEQTVPLSSIDKRFSEQINRDRRVKFQLP